MDSRAGGDVCFGREAEGKDEFRRMKRGGIILEDETAKRRTRRC